MRHRLHLLTFLVSACASPGRDWAPPTVLARPALAYEASYRGLESETAPPTGHAEEGVEVDLRFRVVTLERADAERLEGSRVGPNAWTARVTDLPPCVRAGSGLDSPRLLLKAGLSTNWAVLNQRAYVAAFEVTGDSEHVVADPVVGVYSTGLQCLVSTESDGDERVAVVLDLRQCDEVNPPWERTLPIPGLPAGFTIQVPEALTQRLQTRVSLGAEECLVLSWNDVRDAELRRFAIVTARTTGLVGTR